MVIRILLKFLFGYLIVEVEGYYIERFINICKMKKIFIWNIKKNNDTKMNISIGKNDFRKICTICKKTKCKPRIKRKKGIPFIINKYRKRKIFIICFIPIILFIMISSAFIWNVEIIEEDDSKIENILEDLKECGLEIGKFKFQINTKEIVNKLRLKRDDIAWIGIEIKGTNAIVKIVKSAKKPEIVDENDYCNIISDKAGVITKINAQNGTANIKVGDTVNKGDILINGYMEGKYTGRRYVHALGEIQAKVWYTKRTKVFLKTVEEKETGRIENYYSINFNKFKINFKKGVSKFKFYDTIKTDNKLKLFLDFYLPFYIEKTTNKEVQKIDKIYTIEEAKKVGIEELEEELKKEIEDEKSIVNKNINTHENYDSVDINLTYEVLENIGTNEKIVF